MEILERARAREGQRLSPDVLKPAEVRSLADIRRVVAAMDPGRNPPQLDVPISTTLDVVEDRQRTTYGVGVNTRSKSQRDMLIEGLTIVKKRLEAQDKLQTGAPVEINGVIMKPAALGSGVDNQCWVDPLIRQWLGGYRSGVLVCWDFDDGYIYQYDVFAHKLTRVPRP